MVDKKALQTYIDQHAAEYIDISHKIWEFAELSLQEYKSAALYKEKLKEEGFTVIENLGGIETAFCGVFTSNNCNTICNTNGGDCLDWEALPHPIIGILAEFDALSGLSQVAGGTQKEPLVNTDGTKCTTGHGCGHNMLGAAAFGAACGVKKYLEGNNSTLEDTHLLKQVEQEATTPTGTIIFYGCPGEEGGAAKAFLGREKEWSRLDAALTWHPGDKNEVTTGTNNACTQVLYKFKGISAHAAGNPEMGRSALDAVELMNTGVQYLREHMKKEASVHYAITDAGGISPNVVQAEASVLYMVRSQSVPDTLDLQRRVDLIADGAALMTETSYERIFVDGTADLIPNTCLEKVLYENLLEVPLPEYTEEERSYAKAIYESYPHTEEGQAVSMKVEPFKTSNEFEAGSTDVGDVSHLTPTAQFTAVTFTLGAPGHSWQNTSCGCSSLGDKGTIYAAKVLAGAAVDLFERPSLIDDAKAEFKERTNGKPYVCPIPDGVKPYII